MRREKVSFPSGAAPCAGSLFHPEPQAATDARLPCVVLAHGFSGTMDRLVPHAERFAADGIAALVFDYRGFGESGGQPRQVVDLPSQHQDLRAAIAWARGREDLDPDRVALWGNSLGGAHVISVAADDPRIVAVVAQIPFNGFPRRVEGRSTGAGLRLFGAMVWDSIKGRLHLEPFHIPMVAKPGELAVAATQEADRHIQTLTGGNVTTRWKNQVAPRGLLQMLATDPRWTQPDCRHPAGVRRRAGPRGPGRHRPGARPGRPSRHAPGLSRDAL
jgi:quorum-quenching protein AidA